MEGEPAECTGIFCCKNDFIFLGSVHVEWNHELIRRSSTTAQLDWAAEIIHWTQKCFISKFYNNNNNNSVNLSCLLGCWFESKGWSYLREGASSVGSTKPPAAVPRATPLHSFYFILFVWLFRFIVLSNYNSFGWIYPGKYFHLSQRSK